MCRFHLYIYIYSYLAFIRKHFSRFQIYSRAHPKSNSVKIIMCCLNRRLVASYAKSRHHITCNIIIIIIVTIISKIYLSKFNEIHARALAYNSKQNTARAAVTNKKQSTRHNHFRSLYIHICIHIWCTYIHTYVGMYINWTITKSNWLKWTPFELLYTHKHTHVHCTYILLLLLSAYALFLLCI